MQELLHFRPPGNAISGTDDSQWLGACCQAVAHGNAYLAQPVVEGEYCFDLAIHLSGVTCLAGYQVHIDAEGGGCSAEAQVIGRAENNVAIRR